MSHKRPRDHLQGLDVDELARLKKHFRTGAQERDLRLDKARERHETSIRGQCGFKGYHQLSKTRKSLTYVRAEMAGSEKRLRTLEHAEEVQRAEIDKYEAYMASARAEALLLLPALVDSFHKKSAVILRSSLTSFRLIELTLQDGYPYEQDALVALFKASFEEELRGWAVDFYTGVHPTHNSYDYGSRDETDNRDHYFCECTRL